VNRQVFRYEVPVDDRDHELSLTPGPILKVGARKTAAVEFWAETHPEGTVERAFRVFGTGQPIPAGYLWVGTAEPVGLGALVWHLYERENRTPVGVRRAPR
jgi:hypothetical protein